MNYSIGRSNKNAPYLISHKNKYSKKFDFSAYAYVIIYKFQFDRNLNIITEEEAKNIKII